MVKFRGEEGLDYGGVARWFSIYATLENEVFRVTVMICSGVILLTEVVHCENGKLVLKSVLFSIICCMDESDLHNIVVLSSL